MHKALFCRDVQTLWKPWLIFSAILTMYTVVIISMFDPSLGESLNLMMESMPELFSAFGMNNPGATLLDFIANYLYGFLLICLPLVMELIMVNILMTRYLDRGAMAWLLASPNSRTKIAFTQAAALVAAVLVQMAYITAVGIIFAQISFGGELDIGRFLYLNVGLFGLHLFLSGLCFLGSCLFQEGRYALGFGGGLGILFVLFQMLSQVGEEAEFLKYLTPLTVFDPKALAMGETVWPSILALYLGGAALYGIGIFFFGKKDLSL